MSSPTITILTVNWFSSDYLIKLLENLANNAANPGLLRCLIVDNTNGSDTALDCLQKAPVPTTILKHDSKGMKSSRAHAAALDFAMKHIDTPYCLIIDPDVYVFKRGWDQFCLSEMQASNAIAVGAPYPGWKLGKYHNFPSPIFNFFEMKKIREMNLPWTPFGNSRLYNFKIQIIRQIARLGGIVTRRNYENYRVLQRYGRFIEKCFGTFSQDTGWQIAKAIQEKDIHSVMFDVVLPDRYDMALPECKNAFVDLAREYELYHYKGELMLTHKYGTGVYLWKTKRGVDSPHWYACIRQFEDSLNRTT